jgi:hypothetical protein
MSRPWPLRSETLAVVCPTCGAMADDPCVGKRGQPRKPLHAERHRLAAQFQAERGGHRLASPDVDDAPAERMKSWRGDYVIVFPGKDWYFHKCVICESDLKVGSEASKTGVGAECARKPGWQVEQAREAAREHDRERYRREVIKPGFRIG